MDKPVREVRVGSVIGHGGGGSPDPQVWWWSCEENFDLARDNAM